MIQEKKHPTSPLTCHTQNQRMEGSLYPGQPLGSYLFNSTSRFFSPLVCCTIDLLIHSYTLPPELVLPDCLKHICQKLCLSQNEFNYVFAY